MDHLVGAVRKLRSQLSDSQQAFATRLGLSISAIVNYERDRKPTGKALVALHRVARDAGQAELAEMFWTALHQELGLDERTGRRVDDAHNEVFQASSYLKSFLLDGVENLTPGQRKAIRKVEERIARAEAMLAGLNPFALSAESEKSK